jgi:hypothetical protein
MSVATETPTGPASCVWRKAKGAAEASMGESRKQLRQRIDQAKVDVSLAAEADRTQGGEVAASAKDRWAELKATATAKFVDVQAKIDRRADQLDARIAADDADWAEDDPAAAIDYAAWTVDNARLAMMDAIDARADELAKGTRLLVFASPAKGERAPKPQTTALLGRRSPAGNRWPREDRGAGCM